MSRSRWIALRVAWVVCLLPCLLARADAPPGRYTVIDDGTVYDTRTKLTWQQSVVATAANADGAAVYCKGLALAGGGWRLPTVSELLTLVDPTRKNPAIDSTAFPDTPAVAFWSATPCTVCTGSGLRFNVHFSIGRTWTYFAPIGSPYSIRCVR